MGSAVSMCVAQVKVACTQDVLNVMEIGQRNRSVAETKMNERSSRSHSVLTIIVDGLNNVTGIRTHGCLHLIDLAGKNSSPCPVVTLHFQLDSWDLRLRPCVCVVFPSITERTLRRC